MRFGTPSPIRQATRIRVAPRPPLCTQALGSLETKLYRRRSPPGLALEGIVVPKEGVEDCALTSAARAPTGARAGRRKETAETVFLTCHYSAASRGEYVARTRRRRGSGWFRATGYYAYREPSPIAYCTRSRNRAEIVYCGQIRLQAIFRAPERPGEETPLYIFGG